MPRRKHRKNPSEYWANSLGDAAYMRLNPSKSHHKPTAKQLAARKKFAAMARAGRRNPSEYLDARMNPSEYFDARMNPSEYFGMYGGGDWDSLARSNPTRRHKRGGAHRNRKPTAKQIAARARFVAMVRARAGRKNPAEYLDARMNPSEYFDARLNPVPKRDPNTGLWVSASACPAGVLPPRDPHTGGFMPRALCRSNPSRRKRRKTRR